MCDYSPLVKKELRRLLGEMATKLSDDSDAMLGSALRDFRNMAQLSQGELGKRIGAHENTIRRWENDEHTPPLNKILLLRQALGLEETATSSLPTQPDKYGDLCIVGNAPVAIRCASFLLNKEVEASKVWVLRSNTPFLSGYPGGARTLMLHLLETRPIEYRFIFKSSVARKDISAAHASHERFITAVLEREKVLRSLSKTELRGRNTSLLPRVKGWIEEEEHIPQVGVGILFDSSVLLEYDPEYALKHGRPFDIFIEIPVASYDAAEPELLRETLTKAWVQLAPERAEEVYDHWNSALKYYETQSCVTVKKENGA